MSVPFGVGVSNTSGQLGNGTVDATPTANPGPIAVGGLTGVVQISAGSRNTCTRVDDGTLRCWGDNETGQTGLGSGNPAPVPTPTLVPGLAGTTHVAVGHGHACAFVDGGTASRCWGWNSRGQLGDGTVFTRLSPVPLTGIP